MLCLRCEERGGAWRRGQQVKYGELIALASSERVALCEDGSGHYVYSHICADAAAAVGIDLPGVGVYRPGEESRSSCAEREDVGGGIAERSPDPAAGESAIETRERLLAKLIIVARDMAMAQLDYSRSLCFECGAVEIDGAIAHDSNCKAARVLRVMADLIATLPDPERTRLVEQLESADRKIARQLLGALYTMIGRYGMPEGDAAEEIREALAQAEAARIQEVLL